MARAIKVFSKSKIQRKVVLIFVTVGSWHRGFDRLVKAVDDLKKCGIITEEVNAQIGEGRYRPKNLKVADYYCHDSFIRTIEQARIVIAHAGMGAIIQTIKQGKPIIVLPRKAELGEANTDHQLDTAEALAKEGRVLVAYETEELPVKLIEAETFIPTQGETCQTILDEVKAFISNFIAMG